MHLLCMRWQRRQEASLFDKLEIPSANVFMASLVANPSCLTYVELP